MILFTLKVIEIWISSAWSWYPTPWCLHIFPIATVYWVNRNGPRTDPWGTPNLRGMDFDVEPLILTDWWRSCKYRIGGDPGKYEENHFSAVPSTPIFESLFSISSRSMVSKAAERSSNTRKTPSRRSSADKLSLLTWSHVYFFDYFFEFHVWHMVSKGCLHVNSIAGIIVCGHI